MISPKFKRIRYNIDVDSSIKMVQVFFGSAIHIETKVFTIAMSTSWLVMFAKTGMAGTAATSYIAISTRRLGHCSSASVGWTYLFKFENQKWWERNSGQSFTYLAGWRCAWKIQSMVDTLCWVAKLWTRWRMYGPCLLLFGRDTRSWV